MWALVCCIGALLTVLLCLGPAWWKSQELWNLSLKLPK